MSAATREITKALLDETVAYLRNPANGVGPGVGISDGFASQTPFPSGAQAPPGLTALSKHLYDGAKTFPAADQERSLIPLNALGERDTLEDSFAPLFAPHYQSLFPEYYLAATQTETLVRDLAPMTTEVYGLPHGRNVGPPGGTPLQKWMTEYNLALNGATVVAPDESTPVQTTLTPADKAHFQAKALLRSLVAMINKGMTREYFYAAAGHALALISPNFYTALQAHPETYPGDALGGETMSGFHNMLTQFQGPGPGPNLRQLTLLSITQNGNHAQFTGDGTTAHPNLYDREVLAVLPFQSTPTRFVIPIYVMTRDLLTLYEPQRPHQRHPPLRPPQRDLPHHPRQPPPNHHTPHHHRLRPPPQRNHPRQTHHPNQPHRHHRNRHHRLPPHPHNPIPVVSEPSAVVAATTACSRDFASQSRSASCIASTPTIGASGSLHSAGTTANGLVCGPPRPPCEPMNSSNGATSSAPGSYMQLTRMSGQWGKRSWRRRWSAAVASK